jgi:hypothetical protein
MDKPRHPQVIRPWKTQQTQKNKWAYRRRRDRGESVVRSLPILSEAERDKFLVCYATSGRGCMRWMAVGIDAVETQGDDHRVGACLD